MGASQSSNIIDNSVSSMASIVNTAAQSCASTATAQQVLNVTGTCPNASINISHLDMSEISSLDSTCTARISQDASVSQQISQAATQMASSISQALTLTPSSAESQNISKMSTNVGVAIANSASQSVSSAAEQSQAINLKGCDVTVSFVKMSEVGKSLVKAVMSDGQVASAVTALKQYSDQVAKSKESGISLFGGITNIIIAVIVLIVLAVGGAVVLKVVLKHAKAKKSLAAPRTRTPGLKPRIPEEVEMAGIPEAGAVDTIPIPAV